jgi:hypothetical protein
VLGSRHAQLREHIEAWLPGFDQMMSGAIQGSHGLQPEQIIFIDDAPHNVAGGAAVGLHALHFTNPETLRRELVAPGMLE